MIRYFQRRKFQFFLTLFLIAASDIIMVGDSVLIQRLIDGVTGLDIQAVKLYVPLTIGYAFFAGGAYILSNTFQSCFSAKVMDDMRCAVFSGIINRSRKDFLAVNNADYISAVTNDLRLIQSQYLGMLFLLIIFGGNFLFSVALMFYYQSSVAVCAILCAALMTVIPMALGKCLGKYEAIYSEKAAALTACLTEFFSGFHVISSFGIRKHAQDQFQKCSCALKTAEYRSEGISAASDGFAQLLSGVAQAVILAMACYMVFVGNMTLGSVVAFISLNQTFCGALTMILRGIPMLRGAAPIIERINGLSALPPEKAEKSQPTFQKSLSVNHLSFQYRDDVPVLHNLSFTILPGEKCAMTGESGSGKTTLIRLLTAEIGGYDGEICYDGISLSDMDEEGVCKIAAVIHQEVFLFDDTIRNNICLFEEFTEEEFQQAIRLSGVKKFTDQIPEGTQYRVGQQGVFLSGGQRQRIAIARALIRRTPLLILDEGTSALDGQTAVEIEEELLKIPDLTLLTITHHLQHPHAYHKQIRLEPMRK